MAEEPSGVNGKLDERQLHIAEHSEDPGHKGAYWRLLKRADIAAEMQQWVVGEIARGTTSNQLALAAAEIVADVISGVIRNINRNQMEQCASRILVDAVEGVPTLDICGVNDFIKFMQGQKKKIAIERAGLKVVK